MTSRHPITCHVLDTVAGRPARDIRCVLSKLQGSEYVAFAEAHTNADGRVVLWNLLGADTPASLANFNEAAKIVPADGKSIYKVGFTGVEDYYNGDTFFPFIEIQFIIPAGAYGTEHFHIPLLLSKYSYATYRGS
ncbi:hypothetical protein V1512DRAFT_256397 [Lipomyces arxii]|uniref:uncharacterized protein n=1 Tax=Lipomyces arxii TaxID=56418 RepID=UPI0034D01B4E